MSKYEHLEKLMKTFDTAKDGVMLVIDKKIRYANPQVFRLFQRDLTDHHLATVLESPIIDQIYTGTEHIEKVLMFGRSFFLRVNQLEEGYILSITPSESEDGIDNYDCIVKLKEINEKVPEIINSLFSAVSFINQTLDESEREKVEKYLKILNQNTYKIAKNYRKISYLLALENGLGRLYIKNSNIVEFICTLCDKLSQKNLKIRLENKIGEKKNIALDRAKLTHGLCSLCALFEKSKRGEKIAISLNQDDGFVRIILSGSPINNVSEDLAVRFLRASLSQLGGGLLIITSKKETKFAITIPDVVAKNEFNDSAIVDASEDDILLIELSDVLPFSEY